MIQGSSSLEMATQNARSGHHSINFDSIISEAMDKSQIEAARHKFGMIWNNPDLTFDSKEEILARLQSIYKEHAPEFLYYFTLNELFGHQLDQGVARFEQDALNFKRTVVSPESLELVGGWLASCTSMRAPKPKPTNRAIV